TSSICFGYWPVAPVKWWGATFCFRSCTAVPTMAWIEPLTCAFPNCVKNWVTTPTIPSASRPCGDGVTCLSRMPGATLEAGVYLALPVAGTFHRGHGLGAGPTLERLSARANGHSSRQTPAATPAVDYRNTKPG